MELVHYLDAQTARLPIKKLHYREDAAPRHPNPVRRFREELRLTRDAFAELVGVPLETLRAWERDKNSMVPNRPTLKRLIEIARRNGYPLYVQDLMLFAEKSRK